MEMRLVTLLNKNFDFEKNWHLRFIRCLNAYLDENLKDQIMSGSEYLSDESNKEEIFQWTNQTLQKLEKLTNEETRMNIMLGCACHQPKEALLEFRNIYKKTNDIDLVLEKMQEKFESFIKGTLNLENKYVDEIIQRNMGFAGKKDGKKIIATKIPKSAYIKEWFESTNKNEKRALFCHCPRIRDVLQDDTKILPKEYCFCGGGYYQDIWETILEKSVKIEILETVMHGGEVCKFAIHLPDGV